MARELGYGAESSERKAAVKGNISVSTMTLAGEEGPGCVSAPPSSLERAARVHRSRLHDLAAEGDLAGLRAAIANADPSDFDARDHYVRCRLACLPLIVVRVRTGQYAHARRRRSRCVRLWFPARFAHPLTGRLDVLRFLLERGADSAALDADGQTPLEAAELAEQTEVVTLLKERRIEDNAR